MAWIELHQTLRHHPKLIRLAAKLRIPRAQAAGHLTFLWLWTLDYCPSGNLSAFGPAELSAAADFGGDAEQFAATLRDTGWLDGDGTVHDWHEYAGRLVAERERSKERMRNYRESLRERSANEHVTRQERAELPNPTQPNPTQPNPTKENTSARFAPPTSEELQLEAAKIGLPESEVLKFVAYYESNGWRVGKNPMRSWRSALSGWCVRWRERTGGGKPTLAGMTPAQMDAEMADWVAREQKTGF